MISPTSIDYRHEHPGLWVWQLDRTARQIVRHKYRLLRRYGLDAFVVRGAIVDLIGVGRMARFTEVAS